MAGSNRVMSTRRISLSGYDIVVKNLTYPKGSVDCMWKKIFTDEERANMTQALFTVGKFSSYMYVNKLRAYCY